MKAAFALNFMRQRVNSSACAATVAAISDYGLFSPRVLIQRAMETAIFVGVGRSVSMSVGKSSAPSTSADRAMAGFDESSAGVVSSTMRTVGSIRLSGTMRIHRQLAQ